MAWYEIGGIIIGILIGLVSLIINLVQFLRNRQLLRDMKSQLQSYWNSFHWICVHGDKIRKLPPDPQDPRVTGATQDAHRICGITDSARHSITSYARDHLGFVPRPEHPAEPSRDPLPRTDR